MFKLFTDSSANLPPELIARLALEVLPFHYVLDGREYAAHVPGVPFDGPAFYNRLRAGAVAQTSMINATAYMDAFEPHLEAGMDILYVGMSGGISGASAAAQSAARELRTRYPQRTISVVDTKSASMGEGLLVLQAAQLRDAGMPPHQIAQAIEASIETLCQFFTVDDLVYLRRGGRISGVKALAGSILNIKPILRGNENGEIVQKSKVRGRKRSIAALAELYRELTIDGEAMASIAHGDCPAEAEALADLLRQAGQTGEILIICYEPVTGAHVGPGTIALFFRGKHR